MHLERGLKILQEDYINTLLAMSTVVKWFLSLRRHPPHFTRIEQRKSHVWKRRKKSERHRRTETVNLFCHRRKTGWEKIKPPNSWEDLKPGPTRDRLSHQTYIVLCAFPPWLKSFSFFHLTGLWRAVESGGDGLWGGTGQSEISRP